MDGIEVADPRRAPRRRSRCLVGALIAVLASLAATTALAVAPVAAQEVSDAARELAERHAPVMMLKAQDSPCDADGEPYAPMSVEHLFDNPEVLLRQVGRGDPVVLRGPGVDDVAGLGEGFFLDIAGDSLEPGCLYERASERFTAGSAPVVYAHIAHGGDEHDPRLYLQYWFYWLYNDWNNKHESDWEGIAVVFDAATVEEAMANEPVAVGYAQHEGGERADWADDKLEKVDGRPVVYSSARSHASYFGPAVFLGRGASEGFGCDDTTGPSDRVDPDVVVLPDMVTDPDDPLAWLSYGGRWGERQTGPFNGPTGPSTKSRWLDPDPWFEGLRDASVRIPAAGGPAQEVIDAFCAVAEAGSAVFIDLDQSPGRTFIPLAVGVGLALLVLRRTDWSRVPTTPVVFRRRAGQIVRAAGGRFAAQPLAFLAFSVAAVPAAALAALLAAVIQHVPLLGTFTDLAGTGGLAGLAVALLVGSVANLVALMAVTAMVAVHLDRDGSTAQTPRFIGAAWRARRPLAVGLLRSWSVVAVLFLTVVGTPLAVYHLVRYQFVGQAVMLEGCSGVGAVRRSAELVRGRWRHTAAVAIGVNVLAGGSALLVGLLVLVAFSSIPLALFSAIVAVVYAAVSPLVAIAMTYLYGDARAADQQTGGSRPHDELVGAS